MEIDFRTAETQGNVRSVERALAFLSALGGEGRTLTELSRTVGVSPSTGSRILSTLLRQRFVSLTSEGKYVPGVALMSLLHNADRWAPWRMLAKDATGALRSELDETSALFVRSLDERLCIEASESSQMVRRVCLPGESGKVYLGAAGKTLLAFGPPNEVRTLIRGLDFKTASNKTRTFADLGEELDHIRLQGYAFSRQESTSESWAVAAPLFLERAFVGALTVVIPTTRYSAEYLGRAIKATIAVAARYSQPTGPEVSATDDR